VAARLLSSPGSIKKTVAVSRVSQRLDEKRLVVEIKKYPEPNDPQFHHYEDNGQKILPGESQLWRSALQVGNQV